MTALPESCRPAEILLVEDNDSDAILTREAFKRARFLADLHRVENGEECMAFLRKEGRHVGAPTPDLILLDLNMPLMDGREVLAALAADAHLARLPVAVLLSSESEQGTIAACPLKSCTYMVKPVDFLQLQRVIKTLPGYWFTLVVQRPETVLR